MWRSIPDDEVANFENCTDANTPGMIRVSFGIYNTEAEVDRFLEILGSILDESRQHTMLDAEAVPEY